MIIFLASIKVFPFILKKFLYERSIKLILFFRVVKFFYDVTTVNKVKKLHFVLTINIILHLQISVPGIRRLLINFLNT